MSEVEWENVFEEASLRPPATCEDIRYLTTGVLAPLTETEMTRINPELNPGQWVISRKPFPEPFVSFLQWSNGGDFVNGDRELQMFGTTELREFLIAYELPYYMQGTVPFALDGGGGFVLFDMRNDAVNGEYPVVVSRSGNLGWDDDEHAVIAETFLDACTDRTDLFDVL